MGTTVARRQGISTDHGVVTGEAILGANIFFKDRFAGIRDIVGGRSAAYSGSSNMTLTWSATLGGASAASRCASSAISSRFNTS